jgi:hypothetical protein
MTPDQHHRDYLTALAVEWKRPPKLCRASQTPTGIRMPRWRVDLGPVGKAVRLLVDGAPRDLADKLEAIADPEEAGEPMEPICRNRH